MRSSKWSIELSEQYECALQGACDRALVLYELCLDPHVRGAEAKAEQANKVLSDLASFGKAVQSILDRPESVLKLPKARCPKRRIIQNVYLLKHGSWRVYYVADIKLSTVLGLYAFDKSEAKTTLEALMLYLANA